MKAENTPTISVRIAGHRSVRRRSSAALALTILLLAGACGQQTAVQPTATSVPTTQPAGSASPAYWPTTDWRTSTPEEQGMDSEQLLKTLQHVEDAGINLRTLTVVRNGYIVLEANNQPWTSNMVYQVWSVTKSVIGALTGIALKEGYLEDINQPVVGFFPDLTIANRDSNKEAITIEDLLTMRPGLDCRDDKIGPTPPQDTNWVQYILGLPMASPPGQQFAYCSDDPHLLSAILTKSTNMSMAAYARPRLFNPLGIDPIDVTWIADPQGVNTGGFGLSMKPRDMAKLGLLFLNNGTWDGKQIVPADWMAASTSTQVSQTGEPVKDKMYGYLFWVYPTHFAAEGRAQQMIQVVKDRNMVVVMTSAIDDSKGPVMLNLLRDYIIPAAKSDKPLPANPSALQALQAKVKYLADPVKPVPPLSAIARQVSGKTYVMEDNNSAGWKTITLKFVEGAPEATATVIDMSGEQTGTLGLDYVYRVKQNPDGTFTALRGQWVDDHTFVMRQLESTTNTLEYELRLTFTGDQANQVKVHADDAVFNTESFDIQGTAK